MRSAMISDQSNRWNRTIAASVLSVQRAYPGASSAIGPTSSVRPVTADQRAASLRCQSR